MKKRKYTKVLGLLSATLGVGVLVYVIYPIFNYEILSKEKYANFLVPVPSDELLVYNKQVEEGGVDFTKPSNWFVGDLPTLKTTDQDRIRYYNMSIPALKIEGATVAIGGEDLEDSLIQYPGTALPGSRGNAVIFGHSILPQFFNPKDYLTIFSTLPELKVNDEVEVEYDGISYVYRVEDTFEVMPTDIQILEQNTSDSFLTLVTCVPPGHPLRPKRLIVRARLVPLSERLEERI